MIRITGLALPLSRADDFLGAAARHLRVPESAVCACRLLRRAIDARRKDDILVVVTLEVALRVGESEEEAARGAPGATVCAEAAGLRLGEPRWARKPAPLGAVRPLVIGAGPAGLFAALTLARAGLSPLLLERGQAVPARRAAVERFRAEGTLDVENNVQFGAGGAGTFSDGKLNTGTRDPRAGVVLEAFARMGAPEEILWQARPHIGTDKLPDVVGNLCREIERYGGTLRFGTKAEDFRVEDGALRGLRAGGEALAADAAVLAVGHSARDTLEALLRAGVAMAAKPFSVGVRIEHPQAMIDRAQYGRDAGHPALGAAEYRLACHQPDGRGVYTFCMCPGGQVVAAASEARGVVTNGMSNFRRDGAYANSAVLTDVRPEDFGGDPLRGFAFQRAAEQAAYTLGGGGYIAPAQRAPDFLAGRASQGAIDASYRPGVSAANIEGCLPEFVTRALRRALPLFGQKIPGFDGPDAVLIGVETRSSCPARVPRGETGQANVRGLFPAGEGAGYAGGILSAATDGIHAAEAVIRFLQKIPEETPIWREVFGVSGGAA